MFDFTKVISWFFEVTATVKGADETRVFSLGPMYHPNVPPTPSKNPLEGLELIFGRMRAMNFFGGFGVFSFFLKRSPMACCGQSFAGFAFRVSDLGFVLRVSSAGVPVFTAEDCCCPNKAPVVSRKENSRRNVDKLFFI